MALISINHATQILNDSFSNLDTLLAVSTPAKREEVITHTALDAFKEIQKSRLGWGHSIKKFLAITLTYTSIITLPFAALAGTIWYYFEQMKNWSIAFNTGKNLLYPGAGIGALYLIDLTIGKMFGIKPTTAILLAAYDAYRHGARYLAKQVEKGYTETEKRIGKLIEQRETTIQEELAKTYLYIAKELAERYSKGTLTNEVETLKTKLPIIQDAFKKIGLPPEQISKILSPLQEVLQLIDNKTPSLPPFYLFHCLQLGAFN